MTPFDRVPQLVWSLSLAALTACSQPISPVVPTVDLTMQRAEFLGAI